MKVETLSLGQSLSRSESNILTRLIFYSPARKRETDDDNVKAPHNFD